MKRTLSRLYPLFLLLSMVIVLWQREAALAGGRDGVRLCLEVLIPTLLPLMVLGSRATAAFSPRGASQNSAYFLMGALGGYPLGAQILGQAYRQGELSSREALRLSAFCSQPGPAFLLGVTASLFSRPLVSWCLWAVVLLSALATRLYFPPGEDAGICKPYGGSTPRNAMTRSLSAMASICGWVILFRAFLSIAQETVLCTLPSWLQILVWGLGELTNGCYALESLAQPGGRYLMAACFSSFGGICVWMQTASVLRPLGTATYLQGKLIQTAFTFCLAWLTQPLLFPPEERLTFPLFFPLAVALGLGILAQKRKITVAFPPPGVYNKEKSPAR